jgi:hypothetical protein
MFERLKCSWHGGEQGIGVELHEKPSLTWFTNARSSKKTGKLPSIS